MMKLNSQRVAKGLLPLLFGASLLLVGCGEQANPALPLEITTDTACHLDGMILKDFPGPKAQIHYDQGTPEFFCDTREMFSILLRPEQKKRIVGIFAQDMGKADWSRPEGHWVDARTAFYVIGSPRPGSMGPTVPSFAREADARKFAEQYGGKVLPFAQVTADMVDLSGGASHDQKV